MQKVVLSVVSVERIDAATNDFVLENQADSIEWENCDNQPVQGNYPNIYRAEIMQSERLIAGRLFKQGELKLSSKDFGSKVFATINEKGHLIIVGDNAANYYIDSNGVLKYKYCVL